MSESVFQRRIFFILVLIAGLAWIGISADPSQAGTDRSSALGRGSRAPDFTLMTPQGDAITLADLRGQAVLINLWATWCPPCRQEMPTIQRVYDEYRDRGFTVLGVNVTAQDDPLAIVPFVDNYNLSFPILLDETGAVSAAYGLRSLPTSYFIAPDGTIREVVIGGPMPAALLRARVEDLLR
ncbi:MAG TPA: TlpA disulfide reductase family protein [Anaerolineales bacterium]